VDLGITGQDLVAEASLDSGLVEEVLPLEFGGCKLQVQIPEHSTTIKTVEDLVGKKVVTSFEVTAGQYFRKLDEARGDGTKTKIEYIGGSVEAACALGVADGIGMMTYE
jgi:ATP phosphoribosyltransferase